MFQQFVSDIRLSTIAALIVCWLPGTPGGGPLGALRHE
jgi:hypothetical protein